MLCRTSQTEVATLAVERCSLFINASWGSGPTSARPHSKRRITLQNTSNFPQSQNPMQNSNPVQNDSTNGGTTPGQVPVDPNQNRGNFPQDEGI